MYTSTPAVFDYLDYRAFLRDYYAEKKRKRGFSFRAFSKKAGLGSPNYLKLVMDGQRNLTEPMAERFAQALGLSGEAAEYFVEVVRFTQAKSSRARSDHYARLNGFQRSRTTRPLAAAEAAYHSTWYLPAVRELAARPDFKANPDWIAATLWPAISSADAAHALALLLELKLLVKQGRRIVQGEAVVSTGPEARSVNIASYHRTMLARAADAIDEIPAPLRDISSITMCLSPDGLATLKERIQRFRRELLDLATLEASPQQVVQVNFQLFPLSRVAGQ
ncbi:MAG TPA: TIGR02147 family protein [Polyangiaceae bacterium]|nr:TIGR02147 family protein [Polyangiaceae bacterium]